MLQPLRMRYLARGQHLLDPTVPNAPCYGASAVPLLQLHEPEEPFQLLEVDVAVAVGIDCVERLC